MKLISKYFKEILVLILLWFILLTAMGCKKEEIKTNEPTQTPSTIDCNCNAVISFTTFNIAGGDSFGDYVTQNPCTNVTGNGSWTATPPTIGECL
jgi:hypothetical protein